MRVTVVGATGRSGREVTRVAQLRGHHVTAVVRDRARLGDLRPDAVVEAQEWDVPMLTSAITGSDAVASCVGPVPGGPHTVQQELIAPTIQAMRDTGVRRLVAISASGWLVDGDDPLTRYLAKPILARVLRDANADLAAMEALIRASGLDWTILRPPRLTDRAAAGRYRSRRDGNVRWGFSIARADLAHAVVDSVEDRTAVGQLISVAGGGRSR